jgi:AraC-like DNA-binding protein
VIGLNIDIFSIIIFLGLAQGIFLSVLLITKFKFPQKILGLILLIISIQIFDFFSAYSLISLKCPHLIDISQPLGLVLGPVIYILYYFFANRKYPQYFILHLIPAIIFLVNHAFYFFQSADFKYNSFVIARNFNLPLKNVSDGVIPDPLRLRSFGGELIAVSLSIYSILIMKELLKIVVLNKKKFWKVEEGSLMWLRNFVLILIVLVSYVLFNQFFIKNPRSEYIIATGLTLIVYYTTYHFIRNSFLINDSFLNIKYEKSSLSVSLKESIKDRLVNHLKNDKPFLSNVFSLKQLSKNISASPNHVSQIINEDFNQSYFEFIANYRIQEAKKYLLDSHYRNRNIEEISFLVGYNSKTAFNKAFKKITGKTPLQYKKQI